MVKNDMILKERKKLNIKGQMREGNVTNGKEESSKVGRK